MFFHCERRDRVGFGARNSARNFPYPTRAKEQLASIQKGKVTSIGSCIAERDNFLIPTQYWLEFKKSVDKKNAQEQAQSEKNAKTAEAAECQYTVTGTCIKKHWYGWFMTAERWTDKNGGHNPEFDYMILYVGDAVLIKGQRIKVGANYDGKGTYDLEDGAGTVNVSKWIYCQTP